ncbi:hypothetical protein VP01_3507g1 [Puccinia sorghi]|uniref:Uncharacterized protein n=1 Tax=Puccinia sorghi TaxID=27349 RepID=A0A0L6UVP2_9BASI|nr:hypothetical protein VP01_3507g1 [Puccinia sorghi]
MTLGGFVPSDRQFPLDKAIVNALYWRSQSSWKYTIKADSFHCGQKLITSHSSLVFKTLLSFGTRMVVSSLRFAAGELAIKVAIIVQRDIIQKNKILDELEEGGASWIKSLSPGGRPRGMLSVTCEAGLGTKPSPAWQYKRLDQGRPRNLGTLPSSTSWLGQSCEFVLLAFLQLICFVLQMSDSNPAVIDSINLEIEANKEKAQALAVELKNLIPNTHKKPSRRRSQKQMEKKNLGRIWISVHYSAVTPNASVSDCTPKTPPPAYNTLPPAYLPTNHTAQSKYFIDYQPGCIANMMCCLKLRLSQPTLKEFCWTKPTSRMLRQLVWILSIDGVNYTKIHGLCGKQTYHLSSQIQQALLDKASSETESFVAKITAEDSSKSRYTAKENLLNCLQLTCRNSQEASVVTPTFLQN